MAAKKEQIEEEIGKIATIAENVSNIIHSVLLDCPKIQELIKDLKMKSSIDEIANETCCKCNVETTCTYCLQEHELKNHAWKHLEQIFSRKF
jgi:uncharacterized membrane protein YheB (UPF0754 family)